MRFSCDKVPCYWEWETDMIKKMMIGAFASFSLMATANADMVSVFAGDTDERRGAFNNPIAVGTLGPWKVPFGNYQVREVDQGVPNSSLQLTNNYHIFDIPALLPGESITGVELRIIHSGNSYDSPNATETVGIYDVDPDNFAALQTVAGSGTGDFDGLTQPEAEVVFADLGSGTLYGSFDAELGDNGSTEVVDLSSSLASVLSTLGQSGGGDFGIGMTVISGDINGTVERVFRGTDSALDTELVLTTVPLPAAVWFFGAAIASLIAVRRRRIKA
ncbi:MAG: VPLPA-CTERM sorting domain-containing protein [Pseudomonadota bacterium]